MAKLGVLGLGIMNTPTARCLFKTGQTHFSIKWLAKDLCLMLDAATELTVPVRLKAPSAQLFQAATAEGHGEQDIYAPVQILERFAQLEVAKNPVHVVRSG